MIFAAVAHAAEEQHSTPSFSCNKVRAGSVEELICGDAELSRFDRKLASVYAAAIEQIE